MFFPERSSSIAQTPGQRKMTDITDPFSEASRANPRVERHERWTGGALGHPGKRYVNLYLSLRPAIRKNAPGTHATGSMLVLKRSF